MLLVVNNGDYTVTVYSNCVVTVQYGADRWKRSFVVFAAAASTCTIFVTVAAAYPLEYPQGYSKCSSLSRTASYETYLADWKNLNVYNATSIIIS